MLHFFHSFQVTIKQEIILIQSPWIDSRIEKSDLLKERNLVFTRHSSYSSSIVESHTIPPPTPYSATFVNSSIKTVRIATLNWAFFKGSMNPTAPV